MSDNKKGPHNFSVAYECAFVKKKALVTDNSSYFQPLRLTMNWDTGLY